MITIAIAMQKGGSGKSTTAVNLAAALAEQGRRILVVDCDPQGNASGWFAVTEPGKGLFGVLCEGGKARDAIISTATSGVDILPASPWLVAAERQLASEVGAEIILRRKLKDVENDYDIALLDTPPTLGALTVGALVAADYALVPCEAHVLALTGLAQLMSTLDTVRDRLNENLKLLGVVACRVDARTRHGSEVLEELRKRFPNETFQTVIRESVRLAECPSFGEPILSYDPRGAGTMDYRALAGEVLERLSANK